MFVVFIAFLSLPSRWWKYELNFFECFLLFLYFLKSFLADWGPPEWFFLHHLMCICCDISSWWLRPDIWWAVVAVFHLRPQNVLLTNPMWKLDLPRRHLIAFSVFPPNQFLLIFQTFLFGFFLIIDRRPSIELISETIIGESRWDAKSGFYYKL